MDGKKKERKLPKGRIEWTQVQAGLKAVEKENFLHVIQSARIDYVYLKQFF